MLQHLILTWQLITIAVRIYIATHYDGWNMHYSCANNYFK